MNLLIITRPDFFPGEQAAVVSLFRNGLETLHLRKPDASPTELEAFLRSLPDEYLSRIVIHDHFQLALRYPLKGIHLNSRHPQPPAGYTGSVSASCHSLEEVERRKPSCDYLFLSPIYDSISKSGYASAYPPALLAEARERGLIDRKVIALGGVTQERLPRLRALGFGGAALLGDVWMQPEARFLPHFRAMRNAAASPPVILSIAGSDSSAGAGIQADLKTAAALGAYAATAVTAVTAQNTLGVQAVQAVQPDLVRSQIASVMDDLRPAVVKIGMIPTADVARAVADALRTYRPVSVVYDPVMLSTSGRRLMEEETLQTVEAELFPCCTLLTPNLPEAALLCGNLSSPVAPPTDTASMQAAARSLARRYGFSVLVKGGHLAGNEMCDVLCHGDRLLLLSAPKVDSPNLHGTGCTLSSAIASLLAQGCDTETAIRRAKHYMNQAIEAGSHLRIGGGNGPLQHFIK